MAGWALRLAGAVGLAAAGFLGLDLLVRRAEPAPPAAGAPLPRAELVAPPLPRLWPVRGPILLAHRFDQLGPQVAPVVQVFGDGGVVLRRPAPLARTPDGGVVGAQGAAVVLPVGSLARLDPRARASLAEVLGLLAAERPVASARFRVVDLEVSLAELDRLLGWVP